MSYTSEDGLVQTKADLVEQIKLTPEISYEIRQGGDSLVGQRTGRKAEGLRAEAPEVLFVPGHPRVPQGVSARLDRPDHGVRRAARGLGHRVESNSVAEKHLPDPQVQLPTPMISPGYVVRDRRDGGV